MSCARDGLCYWSIPADARHDGAVGRDGCVAASNQELCVGSAVECGSLNVVDNCGTSRDVLECGPCPDTDYCSATSCVACVFAWQSGGWGLCSADCDGGTQSRSVWCECSGTSVADEYCPAGSKPATSQSCNTQPCCTPACATHDACGDDGCGVSCGSCTAGDRFCYSDFYCVWDHGNDGSETCNTICAWGSSTCVGTSTNSCSTIGVSGIDCYCW